MKLGPEKLPGGKTVDVPGEALALALAVHQAGAVVGVEVGAASATKIEGGAATTKMRVAASMTARVEAAVAPATGVEADAALTPAGDDPVGENDLIDTGRPSERRLAPTLRDAKESPCRATKAALSVSATAES